MAALAGTGLWLGALHSLLPGVCVLKSASTWSPFRHGRLAPVAAFFEYSAHTSCCWGPPLGPPFCTRDALLAGICRWPWGLKLCFAASLVKLYILLDFQMIFNQQVHVMQYVVCGTVIVFFFAGIAIANQIDFHTFVQWLNKMATSRTCASCHDLKAKHCTIDTWHRFKRDCTKHIFWL